MSNQVRIEVRITVIAHVGEDITEDGPPDRDQDATQSFRMVRVAHAGPQPCDTAAVHVAAMFAGAVSGIAERLRHELREKGF